MKRMPQSIKHRSEREWMMQESLEFAEGNSDQNIGKITVVELNWVLLKCKHLFLKFLSSSFLSTLLSLLRHTQWWTFHEVAFEIRSASVSGGLILSISRISSFLWISIAIMAHELYIRILILDIVSYFWLRIGFAIWNQECNHFDKGLRSVFHSQAKNCLLTHSFIKPKHSHKFNEIICEEPFIAFLESFEFRWNWFFKYARECGWKLW